MTTLLASRRIIVTGGASGIGLATARLFSAEGARVGILDRDEEALDALSAEFGASAVADVGREDEVDRAVVRLAGRLGGLDGLVNAAGISLWRSLTDTSYAEWRQVMSVNLDGAFLVCRAAIPLLRTADASTIVNVASGAAFRPTPNFGAYCTSKAALVMLTKTLAMELADGKVRVNAVCPGVIHTPMVERTLSRSADREARTRQYFERQLMGRFGTQEEIARLILFLTGPDSSFTTGSAYSADGGSVYH